MKKAQGISINVIIVAAIALLVLVILSVIFLGRMSIINPELKSCENREGQCFDVTGTSCDEASGGSHPTKAMIYECTDEGYTCCLAVDS